MCKSLRILIARNRPGLEIFKQSTVDTYLLATKSTPVYNTGGSGGIEFKSSWISSTRIEEFGDSWR